MFHITYCYSFVITVSLPSIQYPPMIFLYRFFFFVMTLTVTATPVVELYSRVLGSLTRKPDVWKTLAMKV